MTLINGYVENMSSFLMASWQVFIWQHAQRLRALLADLLPE